MDGQTAVITGASRGIGAAVAQRFAGAGAHVVVCSRDADDVGAIAEQIEDQGGTVTGIRADVRDEFDVERLMQRTATVSDSIDYVVANAGVYHGNTGNTPLASESYSAFDDHLRTNVRGVYATIREAIPHLSDDARMLVSSGSVAREAYPGYGSYAVSKAGCEALVRGFSTELDHPVAVIDPGQVKTELSGSKGHDPEDVAEQFYWAATAADGAEIDGTVIDRKTWRNATR